jgi:hypothetical protein
MLASRLRNDTLKTWVNAELNGYKQEESLPEYRIFFAHSWIEMFNGFGRQVKVPIPPSTTQDVLGEAVYNVYVNVHLRQSIAAITDMIAGDTNPVIPWTPEHFVPVGRRVISNWQTLCAHTDVSRTTLVEILDIVRTRVLTIALELEETDPSLGEGPPSEIPKPTEERIERIVYNNTFNIVGDHTIVSAPITQTQAKVVAGDLASFRVALQQLGFTADEIEQTALATKGEKTTEGVLAKLKKAGGTLALKAAETGVVEAIKAVMG